MLIIHGSKDRVVTPESSVVLKELIDRNTPATSNGPVKHTGSSGSGFHNPEGPR